MRTKPVPPGIIRALATGFGAGYSPVAPGTVGTLLGIPLFIILANLGIEFLILALGVLIFVGAYAADYMERNIGTRDPGPVVIDEIAGYILAMAGSPVDLYHIASGFFLFRFFDILKPPPVRQAEQVFPRGAGIMIDDLLAGGYAWLCLRGMETLLFRIL